MAEAPTTPDDERDRLAREDEERELRAQQDAREEPPSDSTGASREDAPVDARTDDARVDEDPALITTNATDLPPSDHRPADTPPTAEPPALVEPDAAGDADRDAAERRAQADDERPSDVAEDPGYDALAAKDHVSHGETGTDIVDEPGEPDVPEQEQYTPTVAVPAGMALNPEASDTVFVEPPVEPRVRHNRGFGVGMVLLSSIVFAALYGGLAVLLIAFRVPPEEFTEAFERFLRAPAFFVPIIAYAVLGILAALLVNRARWWAYALMSLIVGLLVYAVSVAVVLLLAGVLAQDADGQRALLVQALTQPVLIAAGIAARETLLWFGLAIAARGRRVVARNRRERDEYETKLARTDAVWDGGAA